MIILDINKTLMYNIGINTFSCIIALITFFRYKRDFAETSDIRLLRRIESVVILALLFDMGMWLLEGKSGDLIRILSYITGILYFILEIAAVHGWIKYAWHRIFRKSISKTKKLIFVLIPFSALGLFVITTPLTKLCFYLNDANYFQSGILSTPFYIVLLLYLQSISAIAIIQHKKEILIDRKKELLTIALFPVPPFIGGIIQIIFYGLSMIWPLAVVSSLLVFLNKQSQAISQDSLTGLNNRRSLEKHLGVYEEDQNLAVTQIMLDINDFKKINDQYGHSFGDMALVETANILRTVFCGTSAFLGRYGGDEFVVVITEGEEGSVRKIVQKIKDGFDEFSRATKLPFRLSTSVGYAISTEKSDNRTANLLKEADKNMYRDKGLVY